MLTDYADEWARYKLLRNAWVVLMVLEFWDYEFAGSLMRMMPGLTSARALIGTQFAFAVAILFVSGRLWKWKCPNCGKLFAGGEKVVMEKVSTCLSWVFLPKQCVSCGLPKYSVEPAAQPEIPQGS